ncbi:MAG: hypothetical protein Q9226_004210 [Calogaya cf. arnoldii]
MSTTISTQRLEGSLWTMAAVATLITVGRYIIRYEALRKFYYDDLAHLLAWALMVGCCATMQDTFPSAQKLIGVSDPPLDAVVAFRKHQYALTTLFDEGLFADSSLYTFLEVTLAVIVSCLPVYRRLFRGRTKGKMQKHTAGAFAPIDIGDTERQALRGTSVTVCTSDKRPGGLLPKLTRRHSSDTVPKRPGNEASRTGRHSFTPIVLQSLPSVHLGSLGSKSVHADDLV